MGASLEKANAIDDYLLLALGEGIFIQHHCPRAMNEPFHVHPSIEINFLEECTMAYSFGGHIVSLPKERFCIFWAAQPHRVQSVQGTGKITNACVSLEEFWSWPLPQKFVDVLLAGGILAANETLPDDKILANRLANEFDVVSNQFNRLHCLEVQTRIMRLALAGWDVLAHPMTDTGTGRIGGNAIAHFEKMLRFIAENYVDQISLKDVADAAGVSQNYANALSKKIIGTTVKAHITNVRLSRARMLLAETDDKIITLALDSGFRSLSSFYDAFRRLVGTSPAEFRASVQNTRNT